MAQVTWHQTCTCRLQTCSPHVSPSPAVGPSESSIASFVSFHPQFLGEMSKQDSQRDQNSVGNTCSHSLWVPLQTNRSRELTWESINIEQAGRVNNGQFEENYYRFLIHLKTLLVILCVSLSSLHFGVRPSQSPEDFLLKRFLVGKKIG